MSSPAETFVVGYGVPRLDGPDKVTGRAVYGVDVSMPGMLIGKILRSPLPHALIRGIDTSRARLVPGVRAVITAADTPKIPYGFFRHQNPAYADKLPLESEKVRFVGDEVAAVAAEDEAAALEALDLIEVDYMELSAVFTPDEAIVVGAPLVHDNVAGNIAAVVRKGAGDLAEGWRQAEFVIKRSYSTHAVAPCCFEPHQAVVSVDRATGRLTIWSSTQMPFQLRQQLAETLGMPERNVRVMKTTMGAGFGSRMEMHAPEPVAAILSMRTQRPVSIVYDRVEEFTATRSRHPFKFQASMGLKKDGRITALEIDALVDSGAYVSMAPGVTAVAGTSSPSIYRIPAFRFEGKIVYTNKPYGGGMRGYGNPQGTFAIDCLLDEAARELGLNPIEVRRRNLHSPGSVSALGYRFDSCKQRECLDAVETEMRSDTRSPGSGIGIAGVFNSGGGARVHGDNDGGGAIAKLEVDGTLRVMVGGQEIGQGGATVVAQIAAEAAGVAYGEVSIESSDTDVIPWDLGTHGSRNTFITGNAVRGACGKIRDSLNELAAETLDATVGEIEGGGGWLWVRGEPHRRASIAELAQSAHQRRGATQLMAEHFYDPPTDVPDSAGYGNKSAAYSFGFHGAEVEVDRGTGEIRVLRLVAAHDVGRLINPLGAVGQVNGGLVQALGYALMENLFEEDDPASPAANFERYKIPASLDVPPLVAIFVESSDPEGPYGAKGVGEIGILGAAAAIANAVEDAVGVRIRDLPITAEKILRALDEKDARVGR